MVKSVKEITFFFDAISPYAWLAWRPLNQIASKHGVSINSIPVLFAGLLNSHGQLGPAEIPSKRQWMFRNVSRRATRQGITLTPPPSHPFNTLISLRTLCCVDDSGERSKLTGAMLDAVWMKGLDVSNANVVKDVVSSCGLDGERLVGLASVEAAKAALRRNTEDAIKKGVFGVPSMLVGDEIFWGSEEETMTQVEDALLGRNKLDDSRLNTFMQVTPSAKRKQPEKVK